MVPCPVCRGPVHEAMGVVTIAGHPFHMECAFRVGEYIRREGRTFQQAATLVRRDFRAQERNASKA